MHTYVCFCMLNLQACTHIHTHAHALHLICAEDYSQYLGLLNVFTMQKMTLSYK